MDFFDRVKELVKAKNLNLRDFIEGLGMNYDSYNSLKRYENLPRADESVRIAAALGVSVEFLVTGEAPQDHSGAKLETVRELLDKAREVLK